MKAFNKLAKLLLSVSCFMSLITIDQAIATKAADDGEIVDDNDARFVYSSGNSNAGGWDYWPTTGGSDPGETEHWSNSAGATIDITFNGTKLELYGKLDPSHAMFSVAIDGGTATEHDAYASSRQDRVKVYESAELAPGDHSAKVTVLGKRNANSTGNGTTYGVQFVYAKVYGSSDTGFTVIEDMKTTETDEMFKVKYTGTWGGGESYYPSYFHDGYEHYSSNGYYEMRFIGTKFQIIGSKNSNHGVYKISVDGVEVGEADATTTGDAKHQQVLYESDEFDHSVHTLKVELKSGSNIQLDYLKIYHEDLPISRLFASVQEVNLGINQTKSVTLDYEPWFNEEPEIEWSSNDPAIATVNADGLIQAVSKTKASTQVVASVKGTNVSTSIDVNVDPAIKDLIVSVGNEKLLETQRDFDTLMAANIVRNWNGVAWKGDELNSKLNILAKADVHSVNITASDFTDGSGNKIDASNVEIKWLKNVKANDGRNMAGTVLDFPDVIHKGGAHDVTNGSANFAWVNIQVPENTVPGTYTAKITVTADELTNPIELTYELEVLDLVQPELEKTELQIWQHPFAVANYYLGLGSNPSGGISNDVNNDFYFTENHFNLMRSSIEEYVSAGGHDVVANIVEEAWGHQSYYSDPSMVKWTKKSNGTWEFDYDWYDKWINFMIESGVIDPDKGIGKIKCFSIVPWSNQITYYNEATGANKTETLKAGTTAGDAAWSAFLTDFMRHSKEKGWFDITYISMDERALADLQAAVTVIESVTDSEGNHFKISSALNYAAPEHYDFTDKVDDISINQGNITNKAQMNALTAHRDELGLTTTLYSCTGDYPTNFLISDPGDNYWKIWYTMTLGTTGYMRWAWDNYVYDMHGDVSYRYWEPGDGWYVYPQERSELDTSTYRAEIYTTPRYEMLKQGMRDVAKAKYLMEQSEELNTEISALVDSMQRPIAGTHNGSAVAGDEVQRMLVHSETDRMYFEVTKLAKEYLSSVTVVDKADLEAEINQAETLKQSDYTSESWADFADALADAKDTYANSDAKQNEVDNALKNLQDAKAALQTIPVDKTALKTEIDKVNALTETDYTEESWADVADALAAAEAVYADSDAKQPAVDQALKDLEHALKNLEVKPIGPVDPSDPVNKNALKAEIAIAEAFIEEEYTTESWEVFAKALADAKNVYADDDADQATVNDATETLKEAIKNLQERPIVVVDKTALKDVIDQAEALKATDYTKESWAEFTKVLTDAKAVYVDENVTQATVDLAKEKLSIAIRVLVKKPVDPDKPTDPEEPGYIYSITDSQETITVIGKFPENTKLHVDKMEKTAVLNILNTLKDRVLLSKFKFESIFDIYMTRDNVTYQPDGSILVKIKLSNELQNKKLKVFYISETGDATEMPSSQKDDILQFTTTHNSYYAIVSEKTDSTPMKDTATQPFTNGMSIVLLIGGAIFLLTKKSEDVLE